MPNVQVNNPNEPETIEVSLAEYEAVKALAAGIADQNAAIQQQNTVTQEAVKSLTEQSAMVLKSLDALRGEMVEQAETLTAIFGTFKDALAGMNIIVNVPEQPAPVVQVTVPEQPAPIVTFTAPEEKKRKVTVKRNNKSGLAEEYTIQ